MLEIETRYTFYVDEHGSKNMKMRKYGTACFRCVDARMDTRFHVTVFHLRSGQDHMTIPGKNKEERNAFKKNAKC